MGAAEEAVSEMVLYRLDSPRVRGMLKARSSKTRSSEDIELLGELTERSEELAKMWAAGELPRPAFVAAQRELELRNADLTEHLAMIRQAEPLAQLSGSDGIRIAWGSMSTERRRAVMDALLEKVVVHGAGSAWYQERLWESLLEDADEAEASGDMRLAKRRRKQADERSGGGGSFRPERLEPVWRV